MDGRIWRWSAVLMVSLAACGSSQRGPASPASSARANEPDVMCPMMGSSATSHVSAQDTNDGVALVFTTTRYVDDLRARVREMAPTHDELSAAHTPTQGGKGMRMVPSTSSVEDVPGGARIVFVPTDASRVEALREHVHKQAQMMEEGTCPAAAPPPAPLPQEVKDELQMIETS